MYDVYNCTETTQGLRYQVNTYHLGSYWTIEDAQLAMFYAARQTGLPHLSAGMNVRDVAANNGRLDGDPANFRLHFRYITADNIECTGLIFIRRSEIPVPMKSLLGQMIDMLVDAPGLRNPYQVQLRQPISIAQASHTSNQLAPSWQPHPSSSRPAPAVTALPTPPVQKQPTQPIVSRTSAPTVVRPSKFYIITETTQVHDHTAPRHTAIYSTKIYDDLLEANLAAEALFHSDVLNEDELDEDEEPDAKFHEYNVASMTRLYSGDAEPTMYYTMDVHRRSIQVEELAAKYKLSEPVIPCNAFEPPRVAQAPMQTQAPTLPSVPSSAPAQILAPRATRGPAPAVPAVPVVRCDCRTQSRPKKLYVITETTQKYHDRDDEATDLYSYEVFDSLYKANVSAQQRFHGDVLGKDDLPSDSEQSESEDDDEDTKMTRTMRMIITVLAFSMVPTAPCTSRRTLGHIPDRTVLVVIRWTKSHTCDAWT